jgi:hypothetical protein
MRIRVRGGGGEFKVKKSPEGAEEPERADWISNGEKELRIKKKENVDTHTNTHTRVRTCVCAHIYIRTNTRVGGECERVYMYVCTRRIVCKGGKCENEFFLGNFLTGLRRHTHIRVVSRPMEGGVARRRWRSEE